MSGLEHGGRSETHVSPSSVRGFTFGTQPKLYCASPCICLCAVCMPAALGRRGTDPA